jgi:hypothetical protein
MLRVWIERHQGNKSAAIGTGRVPKPRTVSRPAKTEERLRANGPRRFLILIERIGNLFAQERKIRFFEVQVGFAVCGVRPILPRKCCATARLSHSSICPPSR